MRGNKVFVLLILVQLIFVFSIPTAYQITEAQHDSYHKVAQNLPYNATELEIVKESISLNQYSPNRVADEGYNIIPVQYYSNESTPKFGFVLLMDMSGNILSALYKEGYGYQNPVWINSTTIAVTAKDEPESILLWNIMTNVTETLSIPSGNGVIEYDSLSESFLVVESVEFGMYSPDETNYTVIGNDLVEYDLEGSELWRWHGDATFPFNATEYELRYELVEGNDTQIDWMHANSISWDTESKQIYLTVRNLDCLVKINYSSSETEWILGRYKNGFNITDFEGNRVENIFFHPSSIDRVFPDVFIAYDSDNWNVTSSDPTVGNSRFIEFMLNEEDRLVQLARSIPAPGDGFAPEGDVDRIPQENTLIAFNQQNQANLLEFTQINRLGWDVEFTSPDYEISINNIERFYGHPVFQISGFPENVIVDAPVVLDMRVWDNIRRNHHTTGTIIIEDGDTVLISYPISLGAFWEETPVSFDISGLDLGFHNLTITVINSEGWAAATYVGITVEQNVLLYANYASIILIFLIVIVFVWQRFSRA